jgi:hypothetical protein
MQKTDWNRPTGIPQKPCIHCGQIVDLHAGPAKWCKGDNETTFQPQPTVGEQAEDNTEVCERCGKTTDFAADGLCGGYWCRECYESQIPDPVGEQRVSDKRLRNIVKWKPESSAEYIMAKELIALRSQSAAAAEEKRPNRCKHGHPMAYQCSVCDPEPESDYSFFAAPADAVEEPPKCPWRDPTQCPDCNPDTAAVEEEKRNSRFETDGGEE